MKVIFDADGQLQRITKLMDPADAYGEYIGATLIEPAAAPALADALEATWRARPQPLLRGRLPGARRPRRRGRGWPPIGDGRWVEVDNHADLARAREIACHY